MPRSLSRSEIDDFKQRLCAAAENLVLRQGGADFTMRDLAAEAGCSPMLPYRYYKDKVEIVAAVRAMAFRRFSAKLEASQASSTDVVARSRAVGDAYVAFAFAHPHLYRLMFDLKHVERGRFPELDAAIAQARRTMTSHVEALIEHGILTGDPDIIGHVFWANLHGLIVLQLAGQLEDQPGFERLRVAAFDALIQGLRPLSAKRQTRAS